MSYSTPIIALLFCGFLPFAQSSNGGCLETCTDYHRICRAVNEASFYDEYKALYDDGQLEMFGKAEMPPPVDCKTDFYKIACPQSCGECTACAPGDTAPEIEAPETEAPETKAPEVKEPGTPTELVILSGEGKGNRINMAFDGLEGTETKNCYFSKKDGPKEARFTMNPAIVTQVSLLGRSEDKPQEPRSVEVCERKTRNIGCGPAAVLEIISANYGRTKTDVCTNNQNTNCRSEETSLATVKALCDGKRSCELSADNSVFGDPCGGVPKYLEVNFKCIKRITWDMKQTKVQVCTGNDDCNDCGTVTDTPAQGEYAEVQCAQGAKGDTIKVESKNDGVTFLQLCEIKAIGIAA